MMENGFLEYYGEKNISPVRQDITDITLHYKRRQKLYRHCGIPLVAFKNAEILEIGPGSGYNTLAFFEWNASHVDLVEANPKGIEEMRELFTEHGIPKERYEIINTRIEDYDRAKKYDIVIAEGFLPPLKNQQEIIEILKSFVCDGGVAVITCMDDMSIFIEAIKRMIGNALTVDIEEYEEKVAYLTGLFAPQLKKLRGVSRLPEDWVKDCILNPLGVSVIELTMSQAIQYFNDGFDVMGASPHMFTDYSWYKDVWVDYKQDYMEQFEKRYPNLLLANMPEHELSKEETAFLVKNFKEIKQIAADYEKTFDSDCFPRVLEHMDRMDHVLSSFDDEFYRVCCEVKEILGGGVENLKNIHLENFPHFFGAFGRAQQYMSFMKECY